MALLITKDTPWGREEGDLVSVPMPAATFGGDGDAVLRDVRFLRAFGVADFPFGLEVDHFNFGPTTFRRAADVAGNAFATWPDALLDFMAAESALLCDSYSFIYTGNVSVAAIIATDLGSLAMLLVMTHHA